MRCKICKTNDPDLIEPGKRICEMCADMEDELLMARGADEHALSRDRAQAQRFDEVSGR